MKRSMILYDNWAMTLRALPSEDAGELIKAIVGYAFLDKDVPPKSESLEDIYSVIKSQIDADGKKYAAKCERVAEARKKKSEQESILKSGLKSTLKSGLKSELKSMGDTDTDTDTVTDTDTDTDTDTVTDTDTDNILKDIKKKRRTNKFVPPTLDEVKNYIQEKGLSVNADEFYTFFSEGNWIDSKGHKVANWKQKLLTWNKYEKPNGTTDRYSYL